MSKILISWLAYTNDFDLNSKEKININGPTYSFHKYFFSGYDKHIILTSSDGEDNRLTFLLNKLKRDFPQHQIDSKWMNIKDVIDISEIKSKVESLLLNLKVNEIDIFFSPGTSAMQVAWYICHTTLTLKSRLLQIRPSKHTKKGLPELLEIDVEQAQAPISAILTQHRIDEDVDNSDIKIFPSIRKIYEKARIAAEAERVSILIGGETGTGKELLAAHIHKSSPRKESPFLVVNCSAFSDQLLESRLFGYKKGSFTGAEKDTPGILEMANGGTVFLDEIGDISPYMQQSLLRVLQQQEVTPIGGVTKKIDVRFLAATHRELTDLCENGKFRWDLYYRLAVIELVLPPLRERGKDEKKEMINYFLKKEQKALKKHFDVKISKDALIKLVEYDYPGNVRELENLMRRLLVFAEKEICLKDIPDRICKNKTQHSLKWEDIEREHIEYVFKIMNGNQRQTALSIGYAINTLKSKMEKYGISLGIEKSKS